METLEALLWETRRLFRGAAAAADAALGPLGITAGDRALIELLARETEPISIAALARKRSVSRQHVHQSLQRLPNPAWVERLPDPNDARSVALRLSRSGRALWAQIRSVDRTLLKRTKRGLDPSKLRAATKTLRDVREALEGGHHD
jgi:DNA-binding MarR family transcriptional regulator